MSEILHLNLFQEYFDAIVEGRKRVEYRQRTPFWRNPLAEFQAAENPCSFRAHPPARLTLTRPAPVSALGELAGSRRLAVERDRKKNPPRLGGSWGAPWRVST